MNIIVCVDDKNGMMFNKRRQSKDRILIADAIKEVADDKLLEIHEPSCGAGGMIIAVTQLMKDEGLNPQRNMHVVTQDLDYLAVYMTYVQLSLLGIKAIVVQGDSLAEPYKAGYPRERVWRTPAEMGMLI